MLPNESLAKIKSLADEVSQREGCKLYDVEFTGAASSRILRVLIDAKTGAVTVEQCANVSRGLSLLLDVEDLIPGGYYELEVSSPGIDRQLREPWHFQTAIGKEIKLVTHDPIEGLKGEVKSLQGELTAADEQTFTMKSGETVAQVPFVNVKRAQIIFNFNKNERKKVGHGR